MTAHGRRAPARDNPRSQAARIRPRQEISVNDSLKTLVIVAFLILILWNLGAGLYYMLTDRGGSKRTVNALTRRIVLSVALILGVVFAAWMGWIDFHGVGSNPQR
jgi:uncharacterized transporter YbjL